MAPETALVVAPRPLPALPYDRAYRIGYAILRILDRAGLSLDGKGLTFSRVRLNHQQFALYQIGISDEMPDTLVAILCGAALLRHIQQAIGMPLQMVQQGGTVILIVDLYPPVPSPAPASAAVSRSPRIFDKMSRLFRHSQVTS